MRRPRALSGEEAALWARVAATVVPMKGKAIPPRARSGRGTDAEGIGGGGLAPLPKVKVNPLHRPADGPPPRDKLGEETRNKLDLRHRPLDRHGLDSTWDRRLDRGTIAPDFTLDLHGHSLDAAWSRLEHGLTLAHAQGARVVLVITGRPRPADAADRGRQRGAIRAKLLDWLAAGSHASKIAAVRGAHPRHGGAGAVYVVLKRAR